MQWLLRTKWPELFSKRNLFVINETGQLWSQNEQIMEISKINRGGLLTISRAFDQIIDWARESLAATPLSLCCWLRSPKRNKPDIRPFKRLLREISEARYISYWKQFLYYCFSNGINLRRCERMDVWNPIYIGTIETNYGDLSSICIIIISDDGVGNSIKGLGFI